MPITALPTPPTRQDPANFSDRADDFLAALPTFASEANTLQADVNAKQAAAAASESAASTHASNAAASASAAASTTGVTAWNAATNYAVGVTVYDTTDYLTYRSILGGVRATRPGLDSAGWICLNSFVTSIPANTSGSPIGGRIWEIAAGQTLNTGFAAGTCFTIYNNTDTELTITQGSGLTLRLSGQASMTGNRVMTPRSFATIWCRSTTEYIIRGGVY